MVETTLERTSDFEIVGAGWPHHEPKEQTPTLRQRLKGKPILAAVILLVIVLGCIFAPYIANHDPAKYYYDATSLAPNGEYYFGTDSLGRDLFSIMFYGGRSSLTIGVLGAAVWRCSALPMARSAARRPTAWTACLCASWSSSVRSRASC